MSDCKTCETCGCELRDKTAGGLCPRCLMALNFASRTMPEGEKPDLTVSLSPEEMREHFPQFEILECLGRGGMGIVYKARQKALDRLVAIKVLAGEWQEDVYFARRFETEAKLLAQMNHPNIVTVHDFGEADGLYYIVMEYIDGVNLRDLLADGKMDPKQALAIIPPVCEALEYAHEKGVVHRDIKPENLLLDREGRIKIADFGIASLVGGEGEKSGTPPYMAPEQTKGVVDQRADIYALGAVLYEMLTGERPAKDLVAPSKRVQIDVRIDEIVLRALDKEPERRYQTANEFRTVVETIATGGDEKETFSLGDDKSPTTQAQNRWAAHLNVLSFCYQGLGILLILGVLIIPIIANLDIARGSDNWNRLVLLNIAGILSLVLGAYFAYFGYALREKNRYALCRNTAIVVLALSVLLFPPLAILAIYTLVVLNKPSIVDIFTQGAKARDSRDPAKTKVSKTLGAPPPEAKSAPFRRFWWLFLVVMAFGILADTLFGLRLMTQKGAVFYRASAGINVIGGSQKELEAIKARIKHTDTLKEVAKRLDLAREWGCRPESVVPRLRKLIDTRLVGDSTMVALNVPQTRYKNKYEALRIADTITAVVIDQASDIEAPLLEPNRAGTFRFRDWFVVKGMAIAGVLLGISLGCFLIILFHRRLPRPLARRWAPRLAALLMVAVIVMAGLGGTRLLEMRAADQWQFPVKHSRTKTPGSPSSTAKAFMTAIRDGDIDKAMAWVSPDTDIVFPPDFKRWKTPQEGLEWMAEKLRNKGYGGDLDRLTEFTEWSPEGRNQNTRFMAARVAAPGGGPGGPYLVLEATPDGWRVARFGDPGKGKTLSESLRQFIQRKVLDLPISPLRMVASTAELPIPDRERLAEKHVKAALADMSWGQFLTLLGTEGYEDAITVRETQPGGTWSRFEVEFHYGASTAWFELMVNKAFTQAVLAHPLPGKYFEHWKSNVAKALPILFVQYLRNTDPVLKAERAVRTHHPEEVRTLQKYHATLDNYQRSHDGSLPADLEPLLAVIRSLGSTFASNTSSETLGLIKDPVTGAMERPIYYGKGDMREKDLKDKPNFIMIAAPSPDADGWRLVLFDNGYIRAIKEEDYRKMIAKQEGKTIAEQADTMSPEQVARTFMEGLRDGDIDAAMAWVAPKTTMMSDPAFKRWKTLKEALEWISEELRTEAYNRDLSRLTQFTEWVPGKRDENTRFVAARVAKPAGPPGVNVVGEGPYLILALTSDGWRVTHLGDPGAGKPLTEYLQPFLAPQVHIALTPQAHRKTTGADPYQDSRTLKRYANALAIYEINTLALPPNLDALIKDGNLPKQTRLDLQNSGVMRNNQTGAMPRPLYYGSEDLRKKHYDSSTFILLAAPSPDLQGKRLVAFLDQTVKSIDESVYLKQLAAQAKTADPKQVAQSFMAAMRAGDMASAMVWVTPEMKAAKMMPVSLGLISKQLRDELYAGQLDQLTQFTEISPDKLDESTKEVGIRIAAPGGDPQPPYDQDLYLILVSTANGWRVTRFDGMSRGRSLDSYLEVFSHPQDNGGTGKKNVILPAVEAKVLSRIRVVTCAPDYWDFRFKISDNQTLTIWIGDRSQAMHLLIPKSPAGEESIATLKLVLKGLILTCGGQKVGPISVKGFNFASGKIITEADGSVIVGQCAKGPVGIRISEDAAALPLITIHALADTILFNGRSVSYNDLDDKLKKYPANTPIQIRTDPQISYKHVAEILDQCKSVGMTRLNVIPVHSYDVLFMCRLINTKYPLSHPANAAVLFSDQHIANAVIEGEGDETTLIITFNETGQQELIRLNREMPTRHYLAVFLGGMGIRSENVSFGPKAGVMAIRIKLKDLNDFQTRMASRLAEKFLAAVPAPRKPIKKISTRKIQTLIQTLERTSDNAVRASCADELGYAHAKEAVPALITALKISDWRVRRSVVNALGYIADARAIDPLIDILNEQPTDPNLSEGKLCAVWAFVNLKSEKVVPVLIRMLNDNPGRDDSDKIDYTTALLAALGAQKDRRAIPTIAKLLDGRSGSQAAGALGQIVGVDFSDEGNPLELPTPSPAKAKLWLKQHSELVEAVAIKADADSVAPPASSPVIEVTPEDLRFNGLKVTLSELDEELEKWPQGTRVRLSVDPRVDFKTGCQATTINYLDDN